MVQEIRHGVSLGLENEKLIVMYVDNGCVKQGARTLVDVESETLAHNIGYIFNPVTTLKTLKTIQTLTSRSFLGYDIEEKDIKKIAKQASGYAAPSKDDDGKETSDPKNVNKAFVKLDSGHMVPVIGQYVMEVIHAGDKLGWLFFYVKYDSVYDPDLALINYQQIQSERRKSIQKAVVPDPLAAYEDTRTWIRLALNNYTGGDFFGNSTSELEAYRSRLDSPNNSAKMHKVFSLDRALEWIHELHPQVTFTKEQFLVPLTEDSTECTLVFPTPAYAVPYTMRDPRFFFTMSLDTFNQEEPEWMRGETPMERKFLKRQMIEQLEQPAKGMTSFDALKAMIKRKRQTMSQAELFEWMHTPDADQRIQAVMAEDPECPTSGKCYEWYQEKRREAGKNPLSLIRVFPTLICAGLTMLGNFLSRDLYAMEKVLGVYCLHPELMLLLMVTLTAFDIDAKGDVVFSAFISGPATSGKSYLLKIIFGLLIAGTVEYVSYTTKQAMTTNENLNGMIVLNDEVSAAFTTSNQDGADRVKEMLSRGEIRTKMPHVTDDGQRVMVNTVTKLKCLFFGGLNWAFNCGLFQQPILSRIARMFAALYKRSDREEPVLESVARQGNETIQRLEGKYVDEWRIRQFVSAVLHIWIRLGALPRINTMVPVALSARVLFVLRDAGYLLDHRDVFRLVIACNAVCLYSAITQVFFTELFFKAGTPFKFHHVLRCAPLMVCTREQFWVAIGKTFPLLVNPFIDRVLAILYSIIQSQPNKFGDVKDLAGYSYYLVDVSNSLSGFTFESKAILETVAKMVVRRMRDTVETLSVENVMDAIVWLSSISGYKSDKGYIGPGEADTYKRTYPEICQHIIQYKHAGANGYGLQISREFLDGMIDPETRQVRADKSYQHLLNQCYNVTMMKDDPWVETPVSGTTYRMHECPYLYQTIDTTKGVSEMEAEIATYEKANEYYDALELLEGISEETKYTPLDKKISIDEHAKARTYEQVGSEPKYRKAEEDDVVPGYKYNVYPPPALTKKMEEMEKLEKEKAEKIKKNQEDYEKARQGAPNPGTVSTVNLPHSQSENKRHKQGK